MYRSPLRESLARPAPGYKRAWFDKRFVVQGRYPATSGRWEHIVEADEANRAILKALHMARSTPAAYRVWDRKRGAEIWGGYGASATVDSWKTKPPKGMVGINPHHKKHTLEYMGPDGGIVKMRLPAPFANIVARYILKYRRGALTYEGVSYASYKDFMDQWGGTLELVLPNPRHSTPARGEYGLPKGVREVRRIGTDPFGMGNAYIEASDGNAWMIGGRIGPANQGPVAAFIARVKAGQLRVKLDPGVNRNAAVRFRYNLHSKEERQRLEGDILAQTGLFRGAVARGRTEEATRILGWFEGVIAAAIASGAPAFYVGRLRVVARQLDRALPEHPRRAAPPAEPWQTNPRPSGAVIREVIAGKGVILVGRPGKYTGGYWRSHRHPIHTEFAGEKTWDVESPTGQKWTVHVGATDPRPMVYRPSENPRRNGGGIMRTNHTSQAHRYTFAVFAFDKSIGISRQVGQSYYHDVEKAKAVAKALCARRGVEVEVLGTDGSVHVFPAPGARCNPGSCRNPRHRHAGRGRVRSNPKVRTRARDPEGYYYAAKNGYHTTGENFPTQAEAIEYAQWVEDGGIALSDAPGLVGPGKVEALVEDWGERFGRLRFMVFWRAKRGAATNRRPRRNAPAVLKWSPSQVWAAAKRSGLPHAEWDIVVTHYLETGQLQTAVREVIKDWPAPPADIWPGKGKNPRRNHNQGGMITLADGTTANHRYPSKSTKDALRRIDALKKSGVTNAVLMWDGYVYWSVPPGQPTSRQNPHAGLNGIMDAREARKAMSFA